MGIEPGAGLGPPLLGAVAEREQRLLAAEGGAPPRHGQHLLRAHVERLVGPQQLPGGVDEDAVVAAVPAERRDREEHLPRIGQHPGAPGPAQSLVADGCRRVEQCIELVARGGQQCLRVGRVEAARCEGFHRSILSPHGHV
ncbi:hypothetical protein [Microbacterium sp.]|uniref:hypothetical protein n=1 Tax=Microbacterium sp. TaxID=51671 RepID=UPI0025DB50D5|nr:hypothetical protein [Microbacterium sp.]